MSRRLLIAMALLMLAGCASTEPTQIRGDVIPDFLAPSRGQAVADAEDAYLGQAMQGMVWAAGADASDQLASSVAREVETLLALDRQDAEVFANAPDFAGFTPEARAELENYLRQLRREAQVPRYVRGGK